MCLTLTEPLCPPYTSSLLLLGNTFQLYQKKTRDSMVKQGFDDKAIDRAVPRTRTELKSQTKKKETIKL